MRACVVLLAFLVGCNNDQALPANLVAAVDASSQDLTPNGMTSPDLAMPDLAIRPLALNFAKPVNYLAGKDLRMLAVADFNRDGALDLAATSYGDNTVVVLVGKGDGTFRLTQRIRTGGGPTTLVAGDFHNIGWIELITGNVLDGTLTAVGNDFGRLESCGQWAISETPALLSVAFLRPGDYPDLIAGDRTTTELALFIGAGSIGGCPFFDPPVYPVASAVLAAVATGDFDGDGTEDIAELQSDHVNILLLDGMSGMQSVPNDVPGLAPRWAATGDLNRDGKLDLVIAEDSAGRVTALLGKGDGSLGKSSHVPLGAGCVSVAVADFDRDGLADAAAVGGGALVNVLLSDGAGTFHPPQPFGGAGSATFVVSGDFNGDKLPDLAVASSGIVTILLNTSH